VHGLSQAVAPRRADLGSWQGRRLEDGVIYELHVGTFTDGGTLDSAIHRLDHLARLGIDFVELLPVNGFNGTRNWGYDGVAWHAVQESYGGPDAYARFVAACHDHGIGVIQDVVYNHFGPSGSYLPDFGPYLRSDSSNPWGDSIDLAEPEVRRYIIQNARMWFEEYGVDGLRLDAVHAMVDDTQPHLLAELSSRIDELAVDLGRPLTLIAESDLNDPIVFAPRTAGGHGLTAQWSDDYHHAVHVALTGETGGHLADFADPAALLTVATRGFYHAGTWSSFRERVHGVPLDDDTEAWRLITCIQDHDQIGNRAAGDRLGATLGPRRLAIAAVLTVLTPYTPMLFMGEEWGATTPWQFFTSHPEPELGEAMREGRIVEFAKMGWDADLVPDPQDPATFQRSKLDWAEPSKAPHREILDIYRQLIALRRQEADLHSPRLRDLAGRSPAPGLLELDRGEIRIRVNLSPEPWTTETTEDLLFATSGDVEVLSTGVLLPPDSAVVTRHRLD
jgi:maltooligosyltrehalose trehalohydrolase